MPESTARIFIRKKFLEQVFPVNFGNTPRCIYPSVSLFRKVHKNISKLIFIYYPNVINVESVFQCVVEYLLLTVNVLFLMVDIKVAKREVVNVYWRLEKESQLDT